MTGPATGLVPPGAPSVPSDAVNEEQGSPDVTAAPRRIPEATVLRLPIYQRILGELVRAGSRTVSSEQLAELARVNAAKVRKDLSLLGSFGTRGSGYDPEFLIAQIDRALGVDENWSVAMVGIGNLGRALTNSAGFASRGCQVTSLYDVDPAVVGEVIRGMRVRHMDEIAIVARRRPARHRGDHHPGLGRTGGGRPVGAGGGHLPAQLRPAGPHRAAHGPSPLRGPLHRTAGPRLLPGPRGGARRPIAAMPRWCARWASRRVRNWPDGPTVRAATGRL